jgi:hypothetical protein
MFITYQDPRTSHREWQLVEVNFAASLNHNPAAIDDGHFLVEFLGCHPDDKQYSAPNQRYWKEYHSIEGRHPSISTYDLIKPSPNTDADCEQKNIRAYSQWFLYTTKMFTFTDPSTFPLPMAARHGIEYLRPIGLP